MNVGIKKALKDSGIIIFKIVLLFAAVMVQYIIFSPVLNPHATGYFDMTIVDIFQKIILIYTSILFVKFVDKKDTSYLGIAFEKAKSIKQFGIGCLIGIILMTFIDVNAYVFHFIEDGEVQFSIDILIMGVLLQLIHTLIVGISEEILFRGCILNLIRKKCSDFKAVMILSVLFVLPHISFDTKIIDCLDVFLMAIIFGYLYLITKSLYMSIGLHFMLDFIQEGVFRVIDIGGSPYLPIKFNVCNDLIVGGVNLGTQNELLFVIAEVITLICIYLHQRNKVKMIV